MTSKISFHKLRIEDFRHRAAMILLCLFGFLSWDLMYFISIRNAIAGNDEALNRVSALNDLLQDFVGPNEGSILLLMPLAVVMAIMSFRYLHSKKKGDFFHALPVKRSRYFLLNLENDMIIFLVGYIISLGIQTAMTAAHGMINSSYGLLAGKGAIFCIITFLMAYLLMVLCMILTGQTYVAVLGFAAIMLYVPVLLRVCYSGLAGIFFTTFGDLTSTQEALLNNCSPFFLAIQMGKQFTVGRMIVGILWIIVLFVAAGGLYQIRSAEAAENAMAFKQSKKIIKLLITLPMGICGGLFFYNITNSRTLLWLYFGLVIGAFLFHGMVEVIYQTDVAGLWSHKLDAGILFIATLALVTCFHMDLTGYDRYFPKSQDIECVKINYNEMVTEDLGDVDSKEGGVTGEKKDQILALLEGISQKSDENKADDGHQYITATYFFKKGKVIRRKYYIDDKQEESLYGKLYESEEYKEKLLHINELKAERISEIGIFHPVNNMWLNLSLEEKKALMDAYVEDARNLTYAEVKKEKPLCKIYVTIDEKERSQQYRLDIFPSYKNTIELIRKHGGTMAADASDLIITYLEVSNYSENGSIDGKIRDLTFINSIKDQLYFMDLQAENSTQRGDNLCIEARCGEVYCSLYVEDDLIREKILQMVEK